MPMLTRNNNSNFTCKRDVSARVFQALQNLDVDKLSKCTEEEIRAVMPCLTRMSLITSLDQSAECAQSKRHIFEILSGREIVNSIVGLLSIDFHALEGDVKKEQLLRQKMGNQTEDSVLIQSLQNGHAIEFERSDATRRLRLFLSELLTLMSQSKELRPEGACKNSELLDQDIYFDEVADVLCVVLAELPVLLPTTEVAEALLRTLHGPSFICRMVANMPDTFHEVCHSLISSGERYEEESLLGRARLETLRALCRMCPDQILMIRLKCVEMCRMPALAVLLSLDYAAIEKQKDEKLLGLGDVVPFISGLLLGSDASTRTWFSLFIRNGQKRHERTTALQTLRDELLRSLQSFVQMAADEPLPDRCALEASALLRLYCALKGIGGMKLLDDEGVLLLNLITCRPPPTEAGLRFVALGLCMLMACPSLIALPDQEHRGFQWVKWLVREETYFEKSGTETARSSFGEMLLLMAIHFHSGQLSAVCDLVCSTLGMRLQLRPASTARMKLAFTQDIFPEQVVTSHAVRVPVTPGLNGDVAGFLPVHCIYQLLKSRAFNKHRVPIKTWIYRQICESRSPLHPLLPQLVEVYVSSILTFTPGKNQNQPTAGASIDLGHDPVSEDEIRAVFARSFPRGKSGQPGQPEYSVTAQLLLVYYVLLYEDTRVQQVKSYLTAGLNIQPYSQSLLAELPIRYLISQAEREQHLYAGLFSPLLRLLAANFPQLCLVEDWMYEADESPLSSLSSPHGLFSAASCSSFAINQAFRNPAGFPAPAMLLMRKLLSLPPKALWPIASTFISHFRAILDPAVPRQVQELYRQVWLRLNSILPRQLWVMTVNAIRLELSLSEDYPPPTLTQDHLIFDPLHVLRCDPRVFRCPPAMQIVLYMLKAWLGASRTHLSRHLMDKPLIGPVAAQGPGNLAGVTSDSEREELKTALIATQESAVVQIVLEICLSTKEDEAEEQRLNELREIQSIVCSFLHQLFIADPNLVKLVHFQGYPSALLPLTTQGIPSMHICLDFLPELLAQPIHVDLAKQLFAVDLISHLSLQYSLPKSFSVARLAVNTLSTLLSVLPSNSRTEIYLPALNALVRIAMAFPPLVDDIVGFVVQLGRICLSQSCLHGSYDHRIVSSMLRQLDGDGTLTEGEEEDMEETTKIVEKVKFEAIHPEPDIVIKKEQREEGELEEGELPEQLSSSKTPIIHHQSFPTDQVSGKMVRDSTLVDMSVPFNQDQIRQLFKLLPQTSLMGAEVSRTFAQLCSKAIMHSKIYS
nr:EOG090X0154 [Eurycercus lamellatus]